jgi:hypothetical protein
MSRGLYSTEGWVAEVAIDDLVTAFDRLRAKEGLKLLIKV